MRYFFAGRRRLRKTFLDKFIFLFLDYDGTLTPLVDKPQDADLSLEARELLRRLKDTARCKIAIASGRKLEDIKNRIGIEGIIYVGNHGLEIEGPQIKFKSPVSSLYTGRLQKIKVDLGAKISSVRGAFIEDKGLSLSLHYRQVAQKDMQSLKKIFDTSVSAYSARDEIRIRRGKMVFEIRPPVNWDKGKAALWLLARQRFMLKDKIGVIPFYLGDDVTDEDAFKALKDKGITVRVGEGEDSYAKYYVKDTHEVFRLLEEIEKALVSYE